ncbi:Response regulator receiver domain-containing protein [Methylobacterium sp. UNC300MFChir4.1]|uniref:response regulator n=1 Tax=Methylobacterium sp. UNC300MFChir4.1 TaxID=1502747 RepID=UPI0008C2E096|nr:response regulator [Methylobacterium sp. UNC300MFChir4.1]SEN97242.1 Response regulator receiver domain-containing protein [Methylobacterium sp. UNC300MFChir4.1]
MSGPRPIAVLAEDEEFSRLVAADMLTALGFEVLEAEHAQGALQHLEACDGAVLLYTDINMPGTMDGRALAHAVRVRWPETRIIVCSGCDPREATALPEEAHFIAKPCGEKLVRKALKALHLH